MTLPDLDELAREDDRLRWVAADTAAVERAAAQAERELEDAGAAARVRLLGYLGNAYRLLGRHDDAIATHERALSLAAEPRAAAVALIRLGESYRSAGRSDDAETVLREAAESAPPGVRHFALQHLGKTLLDRGARAEAAAVLEAALALRRSSGSDELVASTERALAAARKAPS